jgi:hypothetical protein
MPTAKPLPSNFLNKELVNERTRLYEQSNQEVPTDNPSAQTRQGEDTKWVWYSKELVQTWLDEIAYHNGDGLRIYFGRKEAPTDTATEADAEHINEALPGNLCLIMSITKEGSYADSHINVVYENIEDFNDRKQAADELKNSETPRNLNAGSYSPPLKKITEGEDYPN